MEKKPCHGCPFRKSMSGYGLDPEKAQKIVESITHDGGFHCHETTENGHAVETSRLCVGSMRFLENTVIGGCRSNIVYRLALSREEFQMSDLVQDSEIYSSFAEFLEGVSL